MSDMIQDADFIYWDNNNPPQLWAWSGEYGDEASEPLFRLPTEGLGDECRMLDAANERLIAENQRLRELIADNCDPCDMHEEDVPLWRDCHRRCYPENYDAQGGGE